MKFIKNNNSLFNTVLWLIEGIIVGFGAIMPGLSGGTLCVAFGMYFPLISVISHPKENFRTYAKMLIIFGLGSIIGFVGLSGLASYLMEVNLTFTTCFFIGLILGTFPELWESAGKSKRNISSFVSMFLGFSIMLVILILLKNNGIAAIKTDFFGFLLCGLLWGVSLVVPGLSSSSLLLFFNIYQPMLDEISKFNFIHLSHLNLLIITYIYYITF